MLIARKRVVFVLGLGLVGAVASTAISARQPSGETTAETIRRSAGLPPKSASGNVMLLDIGHHPQDRMISIVARRVETGWQVSYACAESSGCAPGRDHDARAYALSDADARSLDAVLDRLRQRPAEASVEPTPGIIAGWFVVELDDHGVRRTFRRQSDLGVELDTLRRLLSPPVAQ